MCILSYLPPDADTDMDGLENGCLSNPDGHGWAIAHNGLIVMGRHLSADEALTKFALARKKYRGPAIFHSRYMTHGRVSVENTHPFMVGGSHQTVLAHNGILPKAAHPVGQDGRSDTRKFADEILPRQFAKLDKRSVQKSLAKWCGAGNKLVILTVDPKYQSTAYIVNQAAGEWDSKTGIWHSNADYRAPFGRWTKFTSKTTKSESATANVAKSAEESAAVFSGTTRMCDLCGMGAINRMGYCTACESCDYCTQVQEDCICWEQAHAAAAAAEAK